MTITEIKAKISEEGDFVNLKRFDFSMKKLLERYPEGCPNRIIAHALALAENEVEELYQQAVNRLRELMGVKNG